MFCNGKKSKGSTISQLWYRYQGLVNGQSNYLGDQLELEKLDSSMECLYTCLQHAENGDQMSYIREVKIIQRPQEETQSGSSVRCRLEVEVKHSYCFGINQRHSNDNGWTQESQEVNVKRFIIRKTFNSIWN